MKRRLFKLALFLVLGAVVNVAVAWGCAYWIEFDWSMASVQGQYDHFTNWTMWKSVDDLKESEAKGFLGYTAIRYQRFGSERVYVFRSSNFYGSPAPSTIGFEEIIPRWSNRFFNIPESHARESINDFIPEEYSYKSIIDGRGWPSLSLWGGIKIPQRSMSISFGDGKPNTLIEKRYWIITLETQYPPMNTDDYRWIPLCPIWTGFAINTIFYAAILWLLTLAPFTARRMIRRKRGLCIKCGYDLRGTEHEVCPECGAGVS